MSPNTLYVPNISETRMQQIDEQTLHWQAKDWERLGQQMTENPMLAGDVMGVDVNSGDYVSEIRLIINRRHEENERRKAEARRNKPLSQAE